MAAERRAKTHFGREDPISVWRLAWRRGFRRIESRQRPSQPKKTEREKFTEIWFEQDERAAVLRSCLEGIAATLMVVPVLVRVVRVF